MAYIPVFLKNTPNQKLLIIGGSSVAFAKIQSLYSADRNIHLVARSIKPELLEFLNQNNISYEIADFSEAHLEDANLVIAATGDSTLNAHIKHEANSRGILVNSVDDETNCDVILPALVKRGKIQVAVSTSGVSPVLARHIKYAIEKVLPWNLEKLGEFLEGKRQAVKSAFPTLQLRKSFWESVIDGSVAAEVLEGNNKKAEALFSKLIRSFPKKSGAALYLIGAGPGHPDLITVKGARLLGTADVVLYDRLVATDLLDMYARRDAEKIQVGKERARHTKSQDEINDLLEKYLGEGKIVVRLKGGDPAIYAHAAEEIAIARKAGAVYQIVPGITAATGCAATAGIPLTERDGAQSVRFLTFYKEDKLDEDYWQSLKFNPKETLVFYMTTHHRVWLMKKLAALGYPADTPVLAIEQGTTPQHREYEATISTFASLYGEHEFASPTLLIVGDVVRWRAQNTWKEEAEEKFSFFGEREVLHAA